MGVTSIAAKLVEQGASALEKQPPADPLECWSRLGQLVRLSDACGSRVAPALHAKILGIRVSFQMTPEEVIDGVWSRLAREIPEAGKDAGAGLLLRRDEAESVLAALQFRGTWADSIGDLDRYLGVVDQEFEVSLYDVWGWLGKQPQRDMESVDALSAWLALAGVDVLWWARGLMGSWLVARQRSCRSWSFRSGAAQSPGSTRPAEEGEGLDPDSVDLASAVAVALDPPHAILERLPFDVKLRVLSSAALRGVPVQLDLEADAQPLEHWPQRLRGRLSRDEAVELLDGRTNAQLGTTTFTLRSPEWGPRVALVLHGGAILEPIERGVGQIVFPEVYPEQYAGVIVEEEWEARDAVHRVQQPDSSIAIAWRRTLEWFKAIGNSIRAGATILVSQPSFQSATASGGHEEWHFEPFAVAGHELRIVSAVSDDPTRSDRSTRMRVVDVQGTASAISVRLLTTEGKAVTPLGEPPEGFAPGTMLVFEHVRREDLRGVVLSLSVAIGSIWDLLREAVAGTVGSPLFEPAPVGATGGATDWPDIEFAQEGLSFALVDGLTEPNTGLTRFTLEQLGSQFPVPHVGLGLMVGGGLVLPRNPPEAGYEPGSTVEFESIEPRRVESVVFVVRQAQLDGGGGE